jgi:hypothetical protein
LDVAKKWLKLSNKVQVTPICLKICVKTWTKITQISRYITEIQWLSRRRVPSREFELKGELQNYFQENSRPYFAKRFEDEEWLEKLAYSEDIFHHMNQRNKPLQGPGENVLT